MKNRSGDDVPGRPASNTRVMSIAQLLFLRVLGRFLRPVGTVVGQHVYQLVILGGLVMFIVPLLIVVGSIYLLRRAESNGAPLFGGGEGWAGGPGPCPECGHAHQHHPYGPRAQAPEDEAMRQLALRLASGDITPEDYRARVDTLRAVRNQAYDPTAGMPYLGPEDQPGQHA